MWWKAHPAPRNGAAERKLVAEARRLGETMTLMVGRMEILVERLHEELECHDGGVRGDREGGTPGGPSGLRR